MTKAFKTSALLLLAALLLHGAPCRAEHKDTSQVRFIPMKWEHLPDLNIPRAGHRFFVANGEMVVVGGHTDGFVRTATAEYFKNGEWHLVKTIYPHDLGFSLKLGNGDYLLGGGCADDFGIGRTFGVERYDPLFHAFAPYPILDTTRAICSAALLPSGSIVVSGNWYDVDAIAVSDGIGPFESVKKPSQNRSSPFIFTYGKNDAVIFGSNGSRGEPLPPVVDRLHGDPFVPDGASMVILNDSGEAVTYGPDRLIFNGFDSSSPGECLVTMEADGIVSAPFRITVIASDPEDPGDPAYSSRIQPDVTIIIVISAAAAALLAFTLILRRRKSHRFR